jgi:hypothetical protein
LESAYSNQAFQKCQRFEGMTQSLENSGLKSTIAVQTWRDSRMTLRFGHCALWSNSNQKFFDYGNNVSPWRVPGRALDIGHWQNPFSASRHAMVLGYDILILR